MREKKSKTVLLIVFVVLVALSVTMAWILLKNIDFSVESNVLMDEEISDTLVTYQELINEASDDDTVVSLLKERMNYIISIDVSYIYGDIAIADAVQIDAIAQSLESAGLVVNVASSYGKNEVADEYLAIMMMRQNAIEEVRE